MKLTLHTSVPATDSRKQTFNIWKLIYSLYRRINITSKISYMESAHAVVEVGNFQNMPSGQRKRQSDVHMRSGCNLLENSLLVMGGQSFNYESSADWLWFCHVSMGSLLFLLKVNVTSISFIKLMLLSSRIHFKKQQ